MVFPDYAPLDNVLPRYLSVALLRRLNKKHIKTTGHSSIRWVGRFKERVPLPAPPPSAPPSEQEAATREGAPGSEARGEGGTSDAVESRSGPSPETHTAAADAADAADGANAVNGAGGADGADGVVGREREGQAGAGESPPRVRRQERLHVMTCHSFDHLDTATHTADRVILAGLDVAPLSSSLDIVRDAPVIAVLGRRKRRGPGALEEDTRRGAVVVNAELAASSRVWAAGDAACFPSSAHEGKRVVLRTVDHAHHSGLVAGHNMAASALATRASSSRGGQAPSAAGGGGQRRYRHSPAFVGEAPLAGVRLAMVGECSAALPTHGFWWTNNAMGLTRGGVPSGGSTGGTEKPKDVGASGVTLKSRKSVRKEFTPVLGTGVVFYTSGPEVKGAMLWGFPGAAATAAAAAAANGGEGSKGGVAGGSAADAAAEISARALDLLREVIERSKTIDADLSDERVLQAWLQGLSDAARVVAREIGVGHLQPYRR